MNNIHLCLLQRTRFKVTVELACTAKQRRCIHMMYIYQDKIFLHLFNWNHNTFVISLPASHSFWTSFPIMHQIAYTDDILIYVDHVLSKHLKNHLYEKLRKWISCGNHIFPWLRNPNRYLWTETRRLWSANGQHPENIQQFLCVTNFCRWFIQGCSSVDYSMTSLLKNQPNAFYWILSLTKHCRNSCECIHHSTHPVEVATSKIGVGAILTEISRKRKFASCSVIPRSSHQLNGTMISVIMSCWL